MKLNRVGSGIEATLISARQPDDRIRMEELPEKVIPEIGYKLLHNYAGQIQNWCWTCNIHSQASRSFT
ncbi:hypothetical protein H5410_009425, partial [Solanum commersonii]